MSQDIVREFLVESRENLDSLDRDLVALEKSPRDGELLARIFRTIHTIKGTCGFLGFGKLEGVSHVGESLLARMRAGELVLDAGITSGLLAMVDAIRRMLAQIEATGKDGDDDYSAVVDRLKQLAEPKKDAIPGDLDRRVAERPYEEWPAEARVTGDRRLDDRRGGDTSLRIDVALLDKLMNLVGELVLARNQILQFSATQNDSSFLGATQRLNLVTSELQEGVMKTRMQPISNVWGRFPRVVRDLATQLGKEIRLEMEGKDTELDKTIIEAIKDPLTHVVRNSVDHGIETPSVRRQSGKPAEGEIRLRAFHEGGQINIEISDDGAGIDPERIRTKAVQRGLIGADQAARMSDHEMLRLIFLPGFSTAETVSNISGRGVGMDVVKTNLEKIGGQIDIISRVGAGTTLKIKIPLTLAIIPALIIADRQGERYAIPQVNLLELVRLEGEQAKQGLERVQDAVFYRLRGNLLPLISLADELKLPARGRPADDVVNIVVLKADGQPFGLIVDTINDTEEIVVKPLGQQLKCVTAFAGATIMGDGKVALILDALGLAQRAGVVGEVRDTVAGAGERRPEGQDADEIESLLVFRAGASDRLAIPLGLVARLEEFAETSIEHSADQEVVQYRNEILPLVHLADRLGLQRAAPRPVRQVIVFSEGTRSVGLVVDQILDIVTERAEVRQYARRPGLRGSAVIQHLVTDLVDVRAAIEAHDPGFFAPGVAA